MRIPWEGSERFKEHPRAVKGEGDLLCTLFAAQRQLIERYEPVERENGAVTIPRYKFGMLDDRRVQMRLKDLAQRIIEEICETTNLLKNRPWRTDTRHTDPDEYVEEVADVLHFFIEWCETAGIDADELFVAYFNKHRENHERLNA